VLPVQYSAFASGRLVTIAIGLLLGLTSCVPTKIDLKGQPFQCPLPAASTPSTSGQGLPLDIEVHIDGSGSMLGYVPENSIDQETVYTDTLEALHQLFTTPRQDSPTLEYFRTGLNRETRVSTEKFNFNDRTANRLNPLTKGFYQDSLTSQLQAAVTPLKNDRNRLLVLVSDLDQDSGAIEKITKAIQDHFFSQQTLQKTTYGIALMGIRSQFDGTVYSTDPSKIANFSYKNTNSPSSYRPFYLLWVGPVVELHQYLPQLAKKIEEEGGSTEISLFSPPDWQADFRLNPQTIPTLPDGMQTGTIKKGSVVIVEDQETPAHLFSLSSRQTEKLTINYELSSAKSSSSYLVGMGEIIAQPQGWDFSNTEDPIDRSPQEVSAELDLINFQPQGEGLKFDLQFDPNQIEPSSLYVYRFDLVANGLTTPKWWKEWDWESRKDQKDGTKTYQLKRFTEDLGTIAFDAMGENKTIGTVCFAVKK